jgi:ATP-binding cassette subfamily F protein 3
MSENLLQLQSGMKSYGPKVLFDDASFSLNAGEHVGVIGPNGAGKTTLFKILAGEDSLDSGKLVRSRQLSLGYLSQHDQWLPDETGNSYLERVTQIPIWDLKVRGRVLQLNESVLEEKILSLSGGYRMRIKLLGLLGQEPNLMLLDEPTNYLDLETTLVVEEFLQNYNGAFLLISHDREFLRRTTDHILEVESGEMTKYNGNIDDYFEQKELLRAQLEARAAGLAEKRQAVLDFVARFGAKATKAKQAQSRLKSLSRMETIEIKALPVSSSIRIPPPSKTGKLTLRISDADFGYSGKKILENVSLEVHRGDHIAVVGLNGAGKSTLLKGIAANLAPTRGSFELGMGVKIAFFAQHVIEALSPDDTVLSSLEKAANPEVRAQELLSVAGSLLFSGDDVKKRISVLSGGEKSRVALGRILLQKASCLVLDEPTNHLDFQTVEALTQALCSFPGTVIVVSHDRGFIKRVGTKILEVSRQKLSLYPGTYEEYVWSLQKILASGNIDSNSKKDIDTKPETEIISQPKSPNWKESKKKIERELRISEKKLADFEQEIELLQAENIEFNRRLIQEIPPPLELIKKMGFNENRIHELESEWLQISEARDRYLIELTNLK